VAKDFKKEFGALGCIDLVKVDFSLPGERERYKAQNLTKDTCDRYLTFVLRKLYELEEKRDSSK
jgi:hypothetical protein